MTHLLNRRHFLSSGLGCLGSLAMASFSQPSRAQENDEYRALVLLFQFGGVDCHDVVIPYGVGEYNEYANIRSDLLNAYGGDRARSSLLQLASSGESAGFALPPELSGMKSLFDEGAAALVGMWDLLLSRRIGTAFLREGSRCRRAYFHITISSHCGSRVHQRARL